MRSNDIIAEYCDRYSEYIEMLGERFPEFLITKLAADLAQECAKNTYLEKTKHVCARS